MPDPGTTAELLALAQRSFDAGDALLQLPITAASSTANDSFFGSSDNGLTTDSGVGGLLSRIEAIGWRLEHTSHVFVEAGATTSGRFFGGEGTVVNGAVLGFYVFRRAVAGA